MKKLVLIWLIIIIPASWVLYMGIHILIDKSQGHSMDLLEKGILALIFSLFIPLCSMPWAFSVFPRSKYLESNDSAKPTFKVACSSEIDMPDGFDFNRLKTEISHKWIVAFSDDTGHVLKFRTKWHPFKKWGAAAWLKYNDETGKLYVEYSPMIAMQNAQARKMQKKIESSLNRNEPC